MHRSLLASGSHLQLLRGKAACRRLLGEAQARTLSDARAWHGKRAAVHPRCISERLAQHKERDTRQARATNECILCFVLLFCCSSSVFRQVAKVVEAQASSAKRPQVWFQPQETCRARAAPSGSIACVGTQKSQS